MKYKLFCAILEAIMEKDEPQKEIRNFKSKRESAEYFNSLLSRAHQKELNLRKKLPRPFEITDDINSNPYCNVFKGIWVEIDGFAGFVATTNEIKVGDKSVWHTFFINSRGEIIDPTFGQHLLKLGIDPQSFRRDNGELFVNGIFFGKLSDVRELSVNYFPKKIRK